MTVNMSKARDVRTWSKWTQSGAIGTMCSARFASMKRMNLETLTALLRHNVPVHDPYIYRDSSAHLEMAKMVQGCMHGLLSARTRPTPETVSAALNELGRKLGGNPFLMHKLVPTPLSGSHSLSSAMSLMDKAFTFLRTYLA